MSQPSRILPQSKETLLKSYTKRLKDDVKSILDNFTEIVKSSKVRIWIKVQRLLEAFTWRLANLWKSMVAESTLINRNNLSIVEHSSDEIDS